MTDQTALQYTKDHEWILVEGDVVTVGITDHAAEQLGDVVYVELPAVGTTTTAGEQLGEIESTKSVGELFAPIEGEVVEVNEAVVATPDTINHDPFGAGWLVKLKVDGTTFPEDLMDHDTYRASIA
ncbi:glycine cleavage system protein GcvH [Curtobacterium sp. MCJR17_055]|uniref:glycine cleavage system protein GcvH n=1 Tax=unclassified Curtobacterium TaxID=257496 RepID=UPI000D9E7B36|nr:MULTISPECIES: glycine cleavage system protein GcvH [unclassified Curtobacterium]PYY36915.1 glycine cleavage system protein GcvH [Curtobacterium sp. MCBD17_029]PYY57974.1 glycine cleavage system protein GcvH [Curtobacterium sp. MCPF17_015]PYY58425.1 glycine cleavage system protein GcvH [Curtobacterium sp. MCJR17_055]WIB16317.1 glycine cleavage system protein GcvH [Curtobacterium sp. MCPF17_050]WIB36700.1 glycine cleavage system protein GcvH [Curtobacterium sp. MCJR17_043]